MSRDPAGAVISSAFQRIECFCRTRKFISASLGLIASLLLFVGGSALSVESSSAGITIGRAPLPFVHTNHYLSELADMQTFASGSSKRRYDVAKERLSSRMTIPGIKRLMADHSRGNKSIQSAATIGKMIVDFPHRQAEVWLKRDPKGGFTKVPLDFLP